MQKTHMRECAISLLKDKQLPTMHSRTMAPEQKVTHSGFIPTRPHGKAQILRTFTASGHLLPTFTLHLVISSLYAHRREIARKRAFP